MYMSIAAIVKLAQVFPLSATCEVSSNVTKWFDLKSLSASWALSSGMPRSWASHTVYHSLHPPVCKHACIFQRKTTFKQYTWTIKTSLPYICLQSYRSPDFPLRFSLPSSRFKNTLFIDTGCRVSGGINPHPQVTQLKFVFFPWNKKIGIRMKTAL